ncbi:MAG: MlaD family protein [Cyanobacteria bacterium J06634_6]
MRSRTIREGSVGLLILLGVGLFGGLVLWLRGFNPASRPYELIAEFEDTMGVQVGTPVMYRGVSVGRVMSIDPQSNTVNVGIEITDKDLRIPNEVLVETVESGLIGEMSVEISPLVALSEAGMSMSPTGKDCDSNVILCDGATLEGVSGPSYEELLRSASELTDLFADPELVAQLKSVLETVTTTSADAGRLAQEATLLTRQARSELGPLSASAQNATNSAAIAALQVGATAEQFSFTASEINSLIGENRGLLVDTLNNVQAASIQLRNATDAFAPTLESGELVGNLEALVNNASAASEDLQTITSSLNTPANLVLLQQTLESARDALSSAQKVMADVDEITGDPAVRMQIRNLIMGLGALVSSTQSLESQTQVAQTLAPFDFAADFSHPETLEALEPGGWTAPEYALSESELADYSLTEYEILTFPDLTPSLSAPSHQASSEHRPVLFFDGERYILRPSNQVAGRSPSATQVPSSVNVEQKSRLLKSEP